MKKSSKSSRFRKPATNRQSGAARPVITTDKKTGLPLIKCRRAATPEEELTPAKVADILLAQEVEWCHAAGGESPWIGFWA